MSKDIRSYFSLASQKSNPVINAKRKAKPLSSDDEDGSIKPKDKTKNKESRKVEVKKSSKKRRVIESDEEIVETSLPIRNNKKPSFQKLKEKKSDEKLKVKELQPFLDDIPKRVERKKSEKKNDGKVDFFEDDEFDSSVINIDETELIENTEIRKKQSTRNDVKHLSNKTETSEKSTSSKLNFEANFKNSIEKKSPKKESKGSNIKLSKKESPLKTKSSISELVFEESNKKKTPQKTPKRDLEKTPQKTPKRDLEKTPQKTPKRDLEKTPKQSGEKKSKQSSDYDHETSVLTDEDRHERKRMAAILYQKFKNRQSVINPGCKEVPEGKPNCLVGLSFLVTGVLESLQREEANELIKKLGGKVSTTVGKRLNYMIVGEEAGPKKLATAENLGVTILSEDGLFNLIREKSGENKISIPPNSSTNKNSPTTNKKSPTSHKKTNSEHKAKISTPQKRKFEKDAKEPISEKKIKKEISEKFEVKEINKDNNEKVIKSVDCLAWVDKYKPSSVKEIIGQHGAASNVVKLQNWLLKWYSNHDGKKKIQKPNPWAKNDDGSYYKAALLSGPPGIGKTTTATLVCKELGFDIVEFNASDTRSKRLLKEEVSELLSNKSLFGYVHGDNTKVSKKHVLIMDEVDGMAGNEDRGGIQELIALIKESSVPIICMCNDRNHQKMRSLVNYCYDLRFNRPRLEQIKGRMLSICCRENIKILPQKIEEIITATNNDIRQTINYLAMISAGKDLNLDDNKNNTAKKDLKLGPWDVVRKVFSVDEHKNMTFNDKSDLFFNDYSLGPLFVQQNYLQVMPNVPKNKIMDQIALTADSLSLGDLIDKRIRSNSAWSLLPVQAMFSSVLPGEYMAGRFVGQINFPAWLGKNSKTSKRNRLAQEIHNHTRITTSGSKLSVRLDYAPFLVDAIVQPLKKYGLDGVQKSLEVIKEYRLLREDIESLIELTSWPGKKNPMDGIDGKVKAALTRAYNKEVLAYTYSAINAVKKKRAEVSDDLEYLSGEGHDDIEEDDEDEDKLENDALIKPKKKLTSKPKVEPSSSKADKKQKIKKK